MKQHHFHSTLAKRLNAYITLKRSAGFEMQSQIYILGKLDRVLQQIIQRQGPVTRETVEVFLRSLDGLQPSTRRVQVSTVRQFLLYHRQFEPETFVPDGTFWSIRSSPRVPHIYTDEEIVKLLREALRYPYRYPSRRWLLYHSLFALLYVSGMRISEALALTLGDIDMQRNLISIKKTKFHKTRLVPITDSTCKGLKRYLTNRAEKGYVTTRDAPVFVNQQGYPLSKSTVQKAFVTIRKKAGFRAFPGVLLPRIHDFRHTAAVKCLYLWYRERKNINALLPVLATYLGHSDIRCTEVYLTTTSELLQEANSRFEKHFDLD